MAPIHPNLTLHKSPDEQLTPLHRAIIRKRWKKATRMVLGLGADPNAVSGRANVPCLHAIVRGAPFDFIRMLIEEGGAAVGPLYPSANDATERDKTAGGNSNGCAESCCTTTHHSSVAAGGSSVTAVPLTASSGGGRSVLHQALFYNSHALTRTQRWAYTERFPRWDPTTRRSIPYDFYDPLHGTCYAYPSKRQSDYERLLCYEPFTTGRLRCWAGHPLTTLPYAYSTNNYCCSDCGASANALNRPMGLVCQPCGYVRCLECVLSRCGLVYSEVPESEVSRGSNSNCNEHRNNPTVSSETPHNNGTSYNDNSGSDCREESKAQQLPSNGRTIATAPTTYALESTRLAAAPAPATGLPAPFNPYRSVRCAFHNEENFTCVACGLNEFKRGMVFKIIAAAAADANKKQQKKNTSSPLPNQQEINKCSCIGAPMAPASESSGKYANTHTEEEVHTCTGGGEGRYVCGPCALRQNFGGESNTLNVEAPHPHGGPPLPTYERLPRGLSINTNQMATRDYLQSTVFTIANGDVPPPISFQHHADEGSVSTSLSHRARRKITASEYSPKPTARILDEDGASARLLSFLIGEMGIDARRARDRDGNTVLHAAAALGMARCVLAIAEADARHTRPYAPPIGAALNRALLTPLHVAALSYADRSAEIIRLLVERCGADANGRGAPCVSPTPLFLAVWIVGTAGTSRNVAALLRVGATIGDAKAFRSKQSLGRADPSVDCRSASGPSVLDTITDAARVGGGCVCRGPLFGLEEGEADHSSDVLRCVARGDEAPKAPTDAEVARLIRLLPRIDSSSPSVTTNLSLPSATTLTRGITEGSPLSSYLRDASAVAQTPRGSGRPLLAPLLWATHAMVVTRWRTEATSMLLNSGADVAECAVDGCPIGVVVEPSSLAVFLAEGLGQTTPAT